MTEALLTEFQRVTLAEWPDDLDRARDLYDSLVAAQHRAESTHASLARMAQDAL